MKWAKMEVSEYHTSISKVDLHVTTVPCPVPCYFLTQSSPTSFVLFFIDFMFFFLRYLHARNPESFTSVYTGSPFIAILCSKEISFCAIKHSGTQCKTHYKCQ